MSAPRRYLETQPATVIRVVTGLTFLCLIILIVVVPLPTSARVILVAAGVMELMLAFLLWSMTVEVAQGAVQVRFGPGVIRRSYPVAKIVRATPTTRPWHRGRGVRIAPRATLMVVSGSTALEMELESGRIILLGSPDPARLAEAIEGERSRA